MDLYYKTGHQIRPTKFMMEHDSTPPNAIEQHDESHIPPMICFKITISFN
jgi:hypothetical protein